MRAIIAILFLCLALVAAFADSKPGTPPAGPLTPKEELATFRVAKGFNVELVASEPDVIDPVAMAFDEDGRLYVAEMHGYPNGGVGTGHITSGKIKMLTPDENGEYKHCTTFAEGLRFPTSVMPWKGGLIVANAPEMIYFEDTGGEGKADRRRVLYTGFDLANIQQLLNSLQWGLDNWVYGMAGNAGGDIRSAEKPDMPPVSLRGRGIRFHPETPGSLQPTSGGGQYGLAADDWEQWFTNTNSQHLRHIVLADHYLQRNPALAVPAVTIDIPDHGAACKVHRISPFEAWRVERTTRRASGPDARRFPSTELVPGGYITSACSPVVYTADLFLAAYRGNSFICDPANNLIHRDILVSKGATFVAQRAEADSEFLASTDTWFRPVFLTVGPDGALYILDFYREVIETPLSLPDDIKAKLNLESRKRGRIWRIVPEGHARNGKPPALRKAASEQLVKHLADANSWWRLTAQRLLVERQDKSAVKPLRRLARECPSAVGRAHALWTLHGLKALADDDILRGLADREAGVREQALRLAEGRLSDSAALRREAAALADDAAPRVRFQLALALGEAPGAEASQALARLARRDPDDPWTRIAILSSAYQCAPDLLAELAGDAKSPILQSPGMLQMMTRLAALVGARADDAGLARALNLVTKEKARSLPLQVAILRGLGQGLQNSRRSLAHFWDQPPAALKDAIDKTRPFFTQAAATVRDEKATPADRLAAVELLGFAPDPMALSALQDLLAPQVASDLQLAAVRALSLHDTPKTGEGLLAAWAGFSPAVRREAVEALLARSGRVAQLLTAIEEKRVLPAQIEPARLQQLRKHPDAALRGRAQKLLARETAPDRKKIIEDYRAALDLKVDAARGKAVFKKTCSTCHRLEDVGIEVGPDLLSALRNKSAEQLLTDILDPSREVDPRYINYVVTTKAGRSFTGMIAAETASSITLRRAEKAEDVILRNQIEALEATAKSLMPDGLEMQLSKQDLADVIAYLRMVAAAK
jgi:putative membrane-bound dehydrogenase-like protein